MTALFVALALFLSAGSLACLALLAYGALFGQKGGQL
jgi:hypothetical protein